MANITQWLNKIKTAIYGKDVREAIYNSINTMNNEVISNTSKQNALETKYNNQIKNMSLSNPSVAEVVDARTSDTGTTYGTLGARLSAERVDGAVNLLRSTGLVKNRDDNNIWSISTAVWHISDNTEFGTTPHGNRSFRGDCDNTTAYYGIHQALHLKSNTTYTMQAHVLFDADCGDDEGIIMQFSLKKTDGTIAYPLKYFKSSQLVKGKWNLITHTITTDDISEDLLQDSCIQTNKAKFHGYVGDIKVELGSHATDWSPAPQDLVYQANQYTNEIKATIDSTYKNRFVKLRPSTDIAFTINTHNIDFDTLISNQDFITESSKNTIPETGVYGINIQVEIYNPGTNGTQSCCGDILISKNGQLMETTNYGVILENKRANTARASFIGKLNKGDIITVAISNNDPQGRTFDIKHDNSRMTIYKI